MADDARERIAGIIASAEPVSAEEADPAAEPPPWGEDAYAGERMRPPAEATPELDQRLAFNPLTDLGNAERFVARHGDGFKWCAAIGWLRWDGKRWAREQAEHHVTLAARETVRAIQDEADALRDTNLDKVVKETRNATLRLSDLVAAWGRQSEGIHRLRAIVDLATTSLEVPAAKLDADRLRINVGNGTLHVSRTENADGDFITLRPHDPADLITKLADVAYDRDAERPEFDRFLAHVQPDPANRRFLAQWLGLSLTGDMGEQKLAFFWGGGRNGKSTLVDIVALIAGDYSETVPVETFLSEGRGRNAGAATPDLAILPGVRMLRTSEPEKGAKLAEALIKLVTGGEPIQARHLNRDYFRFYPQFKLTMSGNHRPSISGADEGIWRRVMLVPWSVTIPKDQVDRALPQKLGAEMSGILNWLLDGLRDWLSAGLVTPSDVIEATQEYREDSDPLGQFLKDCVAEEPGGRVPSMDLYRLFCAWAKAGGAREWTPTGFGRALGERGIKRLRSDGSWWLDIRMVKSTADFAAAAVAGAADPPPPEGDDYA